MKATLSQWAHRQWQKRGIVARLLYPLSLLTAAVIKKRQRQPVPAPTQNYPPIIVVGNLLVGGTGKTPVVIHLCHQLQALGWHPGVISRGYGGHTGQHAQGGFAPLDPTLVGDEPSLIAQQTGAAVAVHPLRQLALQKLLELDPSCNVIIADDGLQHYQLPRAIEILVQDQRGVGNGWLIPAGPLREPVQRLVTVDWIIHHLPTRVTGQELLANTPELTEGPRQISMWLVPTLFEQLSTGQKLSLSQWLHRFGKQPLQALAGIGQPQRFFNMLKELGLQLEHCLTLADHQPIQATDLRRLSSMPIIITAKDAIKLQEASLTRDHRLWVVHVHAHFEPNAWVTQLAQQLGEKAHSSNTFPYTKYPT